MNSATYPERESGLAPLVSHEPCILILGSFPSRISLTEGHYYANPRNHFWIIMQRLLGLEGSGIPEWEEELKSAHIAVWDVIDSRRYQKGSMDHDIKDEIWNDIPGFLTRYPTIRNLFLNGGKASGSFRKAIEGVSFPPSIHIQVLPSSSPANARYTLREKVERWKIILEALSEKENARH